MPIYVYECPSCKRRLERIAAVDVGLVPVCEYHRDSKRRIRMRKVPTAASVIIAGNPGPKLGTRVNLDDELQKQGFNSPLFKDELAKDQTRWALRKAGIK